MKKVIRAETELALAVYRTQLFSPADLEHVKKIQEGYKAQPLSAFLGQPAPTAAPAIAWVTPLTPEQQKTSPEVFGILNFLLQFCPTVPSETELMARFAQIGVGAGRAFDAGALSPERKTALEQGIADAWAEQADLKKRVDAGTLHSGGSRYPGTPQEQLCLSDGRRGTRLSSATRRRKPCTRPTPSTAGSSSTAPRPTRSLRSGPAAAGEWVWSVTMYELPASLLFANPLNRYLINSPMLPQLKKDADGGLTLGFKTHRPGPTRKPTGCPRRRDCSSWRCAVLAQARSVGWYVEAAVVDAAAIRRNYQIVGNPRVYAGSFQRH